MKERIKSPGDNRSEHSGHSDGGPRFYAVHDDDAAYIAGARAGDFEAYEFLVSKYETKVYGIAVQMLANKEDAKDAAQDVFIKIFRSLQGFRGDSKFSTWLYRITYNVCLDYLRKKDRLALSLDGYADAGANAGHGRGYGAGGGAGQGMGYGIGAGTGEPYDLPADFDVEAIVEREEFGALVRSALKQLPDRHRVMIVMRDMQEMSYKEIADALGVPEGTVKSGINRARRNLRDIILGLKELKGYINVK